jgi:hypothetical protein
MSGPRLWRYRSGGRWRGGRPRVSREVRELIVRMVRENFLSGAPRVHGELLMLGLEVSQAPYRSICRRQTGVLGSHGGLSFAIKRLL